MYFENTKDKGCSELCDKSHRNEYEAIVSTLTVMTSERTPYLHLCVAVVHVIQTLSTRTHT